MPPKGKGKMKAKEESEQVHPKKKSRKSTDKDEAPTKKRVASLSAAEKEAKINALVRYLLFASTGARPVKVESIVRDVLSTVPDAHHHALIEFATKKLEDVFGLTLELLGPPDTATIASKLYDSDDAGSGDDQDGGAPATQSKMKEVKRDRYRKADLLVVLNCVKKGFRDADAFSSRNEERWGLAMTILAFVYTSGNEVNENQLIKFLKDVGISWNKGKHDELKSSGSVLVQELTSQKFLYKKQGEQTGDARIALYRWGPRAKAEVSEGDVLAFLADVYGQPLSVWADMLNRPIAGMDDSDDDEL